MDDDIDKIAIGEIDADIASGEIPAQISSGEEEADKLTGGRGGVPGDEETKDHESKSILKATAEEFVPPSDLKSVGARFVPGVGLVYDHYPTVADISDPIQVPEPEIVSTPHFTNPLCVMSFNILDYTNTHYRSCFVYSL